MRGLGLQYANLALAITGQDENKLPSAVNCPEEQTALSSKLLSRAKCPRSTLSSAAIRSEEQIQIKICLGLVDDTSLIVCTPGQQAFYLQAEEEHGNPPVGNAMQGCRPLPHQEGRNGHQAVQHHPDGAEHVCGKPPACHTAAEVKRTKIFGLFHLRVVGAWIANDKNRGGGGGGGGRYLEYQGNHGHEAVCCLSHGMCVKGSHLQLTWHKLRRKHFWHRQVID